MIGFPVINKLIVSMTEEAVAAAFLMELSIDVNIDMPLHGSGKMKLFVSFRNIQLIIIVICFH